MRKEEQEYCRDCQKKKYAFEAGKSIWVHKAPVSQGIYRFKYKNRRCYGEIFAAEMAAELGDAVKQWKIEEIIPVPLHRSRQRIRGYNQAQILAEELGKRLDLPVNKDAEKRIQKTRPQKVLGSRDRIRNLKGAFGVTKSWIPKKCVLVIDDIYTTGNTIHRVAKVLKNAGAQKVYFLTISIGQGL